MVWSRKAPSKVRAVDDTFSVNLLDARTAKGLSRQALSMRSGIAVRVIEKIEGSTGPHYRPASIGEAVVLSRALGVQPAELLKDRQAQPEAPQSHYAPESAR